MPDFQTTPATVTWRVHFRSAPQIVYEFLDCAEKRSRYWAESANETDGCIHFRFLNDIHCTGRILERIPGRLFRAEYFDWEVTFELADDAAGGCDMTMNCRLHNETQKCEAAAGWVSCLLAMKAAVDFGVDLRNHDSERTWASGFADN